MVTQSHITSHLVLSLLILSGAVEQA